MRPMQPAKGRLGQHMLPSILFESQGIENHNLCRADDEAAAEAMHAIQQGLGPSIMNSVIL